MTEIDKLVEECARDICVEMGNDPDADAGMVAGEGCATWECFTNEARAVIRRTLEFAAGRAKVAWLTTDCGAIGDAEYGEALCNEISEALRSLAKAEG